MIQQVLAKPEVWARMLEADWRGLTPLIYHHVNPYGVFHLDLNSRIPLEDVSEIPLTVAGNDGLLN